MQLCTLHIRFLQEGGVPTTDSLGSKSDNSAQVRDLSLDIIYSRNLVPSAQKFC